MSKKLPAIQFYTGDWLKDEGVNLSSLAAQGLWINMLCYMNASPVRGTLAKANGEAMTVEDLAHLVRISVKDCQALLDELTRNNVPSLDLNGSIPMYTSRRMLADERVRQRCAEGGRKGGGNPTFKTQGQSVSERLKGSSSSSSISSSTSTSSSTSIYIPPEKVGSMYGSNVQDAAEQVWLTIPAKRRRQPSTTKKAIQVAIGQEIEDYDNLDDVVRHLSDSVSAYYRSPEGEGGYYVYPAKFFDEERYKEAKEAWNGREKARNGL